MDSNEVNAKEERTKRQFSKYGDGFALLPFGQHARDGNIATWSDPWMSVLTVLISFENKETRKSYPSFDTIAALAGVSKSSIGAIIHQIQDNK